MRYFLGIIFILSILSGYTISQLKSDKSESKLAGDLRVLVVPQGGTGSSGFASSSTIISGTGSTSPLVASSSPMFGFVNATTTATSTFVGGIKINLLNIISTIASSTFNNGLRIIDGTIQINKLLSCSGSSAINTDALGNIRCGTVSASVTPAGNDTEIQFNDGGSLGADSNFAWNKTTNTLTVTGATASSSIATLGLTTAGLSSSNGITLTGGSLLNTSSATSTWPSSGLSVVGGGLVSSQGLTITGGNILSSGLLTITNSGSSTFSGAIGTAGLSTSNGLTLTGGGILSSGSLTVTNAGTSTFTGGITSANLQASSLTSSGALSLFSTGANSILFQTNGSEQGVLTSAGRFGIGTTTPGLLASFAGNGLFGGSTGTTTIEHGVNLATKGGGVTIGTTSPSTAYKVLIDGSVTTVQKRIASAASPTFNWSESNDQIMALSQAGHSISFSGGQPGATLKLELCQDATGNRTVTSWGANILFMTSDLANSTSTPGLTTKAGTCNIFAFKVSMATGTQIYRGTLPVKDK